MTTLPGVAARTITTNRLTTRVLFTGPDDGVPVLFVHGNISSATWWEDTMLALPPGYRGIAPDQRGFGAADPAKKIDATRGMGDLADDAIALLDTLAIPRMHVVGNSLGGNVVWRMMMDYPDRLLTVTLPGPGSPYGFGGTKDADGTPCYDDYAGSGGGLFARKFVQRIADGDRSTESPMSPRSMLRSLVYKPPFIPLREDAMIEATLATHIGEQDLPGDIVKSPNWPGIAPGVWGATNALSPKYVGDVNRIIQADPKPPVLWVRGADDLSVSDEAGGDVGTLGKQGIVRGYPGEDVFPPQPMIAQTRAVLDRYREAGGYYRELVIPDCGHLPFMEKAEAFNKAFHAHLRRELNK